MTGYGHHGWPRPTDWWHARHRLGCWAITLVLLVGGGTVLLLLLDLVAGG